MSWFPWPLLVEKLQLPMNELPLPRCSLMHCHYEAEGGRVMPRCDLSVPMKEQERRHHKRNSTDE